MQDFARIGIAQMTSAKPMSGIFIKSFGAFMSDRRCQYPSH